MSRPYPRPSPGTYSSPGLWRYRLVTTEARLGSDHPAARAALGRMLAAKGSVPQFGAHTPEAIAWHRATGAQPGYWNRAYRTQARAAVS